MTFVKSGNVFNGSFLNGLQTKVNGDNVKPLNGKPSALTEGLAIKKSDLEKSEDENINNLILSETPILYKQNGVSVSKIPYLFITPVPKYFYDKELFKNENTWKFVSWSFSKCSNQSRIIQHDNCELTLQPYEFICGRNSSSAECFLTPKEFRGQLDSLLKRGLIQKGANSKANRFSTYIWLTDRFSDIKGQPIVQPKGQLRANSGPQSRRIEDIEDKEDHPSIPSFEKTSDLMIDDSFDKNKKNEEKILVCSDVYLTQRELQECISFHGSIEKVKIQIDKIKKSPSRTYEIKAWASAIKKWKFKDEFIDKYQENKQKGEYIQKIYSNSPGWSARVYFDKIKDQSGILFECHGAINNTIFVSFLDFEFEKKCIDIIKTKKMKKTGQKNE